MPWATRMFLIIAAITLPLYVYVAFRCATAVATLRARPPRRARIVALLALGWLYLLPVLYAGFWLSGHRTPALLGGRTLGVADYLFNFPFWWGLITLIETLPYYLLLELAGLAVRLRAPGGRLKSFWLPAARVVTVALLALVVAIRLYLDTFTVQDSRVRVPTGIAELDSLSITLIGDIQVDRYTNGAKLARFDTLFRAGHPDLVVFVGDLVTGGRDFLAQAETTIASPGGTLGAYGVMGDHDYWTDPVGIPQAFRSSGWTFLTNEHHVVEYRGRRILLSGVTYVYSQRISQSELRAFFAAAPAADFKILIVHQPAEMLVRLAQETGYQLVLAGHTHGGQIVFHPFGFPFTPSLFETPYWRGTHAVGNTTVIITNGVGQSLAPIRYGAPAEVTHITLTAGHDRTLTESQRDSLVSQHGSE